jgi:hypothetical protein
LKFVAAVLLAFAVSASAEEPKPATPCSPEIPGFEPCVLVGSAYAGTATLFKPNENKFALAFSRLQGDLRTGIGGLHLAARIDVGAQPDAESKGSFQSVEVRGMLYLPLSSVVSLAAVGGASAPLVSGDGIVCKYPSLVGGGLLLGSPRARSWAFLGAGLDQAAGNGAKALFAVQFRLRGNTYLIVDGAWGGANSYFRPGSALGTPQ